MKYINERWLKWGDRLWKATLILSLLGVVLVFFTGCSATPVVEEAPATTPAVAQEPDYASETAELLRILDAAGCDFAAVVATRGEARKSATRTQVACK